MRLSEYFGGEAPICLDDARNAARPASLVAGTDARAVVAVEILVEKDVVSPMRVSLEFLRAAKDRPAPRAVPDKCSDEPFCQLLPDLEQCQVFPRAGRALHLEGVAVISTQPQEGEVEQEVHRHPDRPPPVGVSAEHPAVRVARKIGNAIFLAAKSENEGMVQVVARESANAMRTEELVLVEHPLKNAAQFVLVHSCEHASARQTRCARHVEVCRKLGVTLHKLPDAFPSYWQLLKYVFLEDRDCRQGQKANH